MSRKNSVLPLLNSRAVHPKGAKRIRGAFDPEEILTVTLVLRSASPPQKRGDLLKEHSIPFARPQLSSEQFVRHHGSTPADLNLVKRFAKKNGLRVVDASRSKRSVVVSGMAAQLSKAFGVGFTRHSHEGVTYRSYQRQIQLPPSLEGVVEAILGLENRALMTHDAFLHAHLAERSSVPEDVMHAYHFPMNANGQGQRIAIIELGGGFYPEDIDVYFKKIGMKVPTLHVIEMDGQRNNPAPREMIKKILDNMGAAPKKKTAASEDKTEGIRALWTIETTLDIELAGSFANGAEIVVYFAPNNAQGKYHALSEALTNEKLAPTLISCSWGATEDSLQKDFMQSFDRLLQDAAFRGVTVCFSSGDRGDDSGQDGKPRAHFPACSPHVLSCGGTHFVPPSDEGLREIVWSEKLPYGLVQSGGGVSQNFSEPDWQASSGVELKTKMKGRGLPDVSGKADMTTGYGMVVGGYNVAMGGTSSVAPMWAGLIARLNQELGKNIGYLTPFLYQDLCGDAFNDITEGNNGSHFHAWPGWDACTGLGSPNGEKLLEALRKVKTTR